MSTAEQGGATANATTSSYGGGGAGGKLRKKPFRRQTTPYDRPPTPLPVNNTNTDSYGSRLTKMVVDSASKLISYGAGRFIPSVFRRSLPPPPPPPPQPHQPPGFVPFSRILEYVPGCFISVSLVRFVDSMLIILGFLFFTHFCSKYLIFNGILLLSSNWTSCFGKMFQIWHRIVHLFLYLMLTVLLAGYVLCVKTFFLFG